MFGFHGIWQGTSVLYDRKTRSRWLHLSGECIEGDLKGAKLRPIACRHVLWAEWKRDHPETLVMAPHNELKSEYFSKESSRRGGARFPPHFRLTIDNHDQRLPETAMLLGVKTEQAARAFPFYQLASLRNGVLNDVVGKTPVVVLYDSATGSAVAHARTLDDSTLEFDRRSDGLLADRKSGAIFDRDGRCVDGSLKGKRLPQLFFLQAEWYGWSAVYPETSVYQRR